MGFLFFPSEKEKQENIRKTLMEYRVNPKANLKSAPLIHVLASLLESHRKVIVLFVDETLYTPEERKHADHVGELLYRSMQERRELITAALSAIATNSNPARHKVLSEVLDYIEADKSLFDADRLCYKEVVIDLARAAALDESLSGIKLHKRIMEDIGAINEIEKMYNKEISHIFERFSNRGIIRKREKWEAYIARLKKLYNRQTILKEYAVISPIKADKTQKFAQITGLSFPEKTILLTFDDGPHYTYSEEIAAILNQYGISGVFFTLGCHLGEIKADGKVILSGLSKVSKNLYAKGHRIANHTYMHSQLNKVSLERVSNEIYFTERLLSAIGVTENRLFRFPFGEVSPESLKIVADANLFAMKWNIDSRDWADPIPNSIVERVISIVDQEKKGIVLFHDVNERTVKALPMVINRLINEGYRFGKWENDQCVPQDAVSNIANDAVLSSSYHRSFAVVIGIDEYTAWPKLQYAVKDADAVASTLGSTYGFQKESIFVLKNGEATRKGILNLMTDKLAAAANNKDDRVFVFFAGHGTTRHLNSGRDLGYIIPVEASLENAAADAIPMSDLQHIAESLVAKHVFFVMDCCYGGLGLTRGVSLQNYLRDNATRQGRQMLTAGGADQLVADSGPGGHSVFTWILLQALEGKADLNGDRFITATELAAYVAPTVASISHQTPAFGSLPGSKGGEFIFELPENTEFLNSLTPQFGTNALSLQHTIDESLRSNSSRTIELPATKELPAQKFIIKQVDVPPIQAAQRANDRGVQAFREVRYDEAVRCFKEALSLRPGDPQAANNLGYVYFLQSNYSDAIHWIGQSLMYEPSRAIAHYNLAEIYSATHEREKAIKELELYISLAPKAPNIKYAREQLKALKKR